MTYYFLTPKEWEKVFSDFADLASDKHYRKIKYSDYKELNKLWTNSIGVVVMRDGHAITVEVYRKAVDYDGSNQTIINRYCYTYTDESLGAFLYENYIKKGKWHRMTYGNYNDEKLMKELQRQISASTATACSDCVSAVKIEDIASAKTWLDDTALVGRTANTWGYSYDGSDCTNAAKTEVVSYYDDVVGQLSTKANIVDVDEKIQKAITKHENADKIFMNEKENVNMKGFNFDFGPCTGDQVRMSMYGMAVKNAAGTYVSYNPKSKEIVDVDILNFDGGKYMYKFPVALAQVAVGDVIVHNRKPMFVIETDLAGKNLTVVDVCAGEQKTVIPTVNMFGFNFITKIVSLFDMCGGVATATEDQPFGNMLPLMLLSGDNKDIDPMVFLMMSQTSGTPNIFANPMMLYFMMKDGKGSKDMDPLMLMMLMGQNHTCGCHKHDTSEDTPSV